MSIRMLPRWSVRHTRHAHIETYITGSNKFNLSIRYTLYANCCAGVGCEHECFCATGVLHSEGYVYPNLRLRRRRLHIMTSHES